MSNYDAALPFPRGQTLSDGGEITLGDAGFDELEGRVFEYPDNIHGTGTITRLRIVKNDTGSDITVARKFGEFSTDTGDVGRRIGTFPCNTAGAIVLPLDDAYPVGMTIPDDDLFYVVYEGYCDVLTGASVGSLAAGCSISSDNAGLINNAAGVAAGSFVVGTIADKAPFQASSATKILVAGPPLAMPPAA